MFCFLIFTFNQEKERKARRRGKALQNEETSATFAAEEEEMEGSGASCNEEEAPEDGEGTRPLFHVLHVATFFHKQFFVV